MFDIPPQTASMRFVSSYASKKFSPVLSRLSSFMGRFPWSVDCRFVMEDTYTLPSPVWFRVTKSARD